MARIFKRPGDAEWWLDYTESGRRRRVKTNTTSKREAEDLLAEKRTDLKRVQLGLEVAPTSKVKTLGAAWEMWLERWCPDGSKKQEQYRYSANVKGTRLAERNLSEINGEMLDAWFTSKLKDQSPRRVNGHRRILRCVYNTMVRKRLFRGVNPVKETRPLEEPERAYELLTEMEFKRALQHVPADWRPIFHLAFVTGLRRGEIYALKKDRTVVDIERAILTPRGSNSRAMPKGKRVRSIPLTPDALALISEAWDAASYGGYLFPAQDGSIRSEHLRPTDVLRTAMAAAGLVEGWDHRCRSRTCRKGGVVEQRHPDEQQRKCPRCGWIMWPRPIVRQVRFHDLRHSTADYLLDNGVELADVSQMLRHSTIAITEKTYRHRTVEALRKVIDKPSLTGLEKRLEQLAAGQPLPVATIIREASKKLALVRHQPTASPPELRAKEE